MKTEAIDVEHRRVFYEMLKKSINTKPPKGKYGKDEQAWHVGDIAWAVHCCADVCGKDLTIEVLGLLTAQVSDPKFWKALENDRARGARS